jgi:hypothetical protein
MKQQLFDDDSDENFVDAEEAFQKPHFEGVKGHTLL